MILLDVIKLNLPSFSIKEETKKKLDKKGWVGALLLGFLFASMLCPVSAAFFFSNLLQSDGNPLILLLYGLGTGIPVLFFAFVLSFFVGKIGQYYKMITKFEKIARKMTALIFIGIGLYYLITGGV